MLLYAHGIEHLVETLGLSESYPAPFQADCTLVREFLKELLGIPSDLHPAFKGLLHHSALRTKLKQEGWKYSINEWTPAQAQDVLSRSGHPNRLDPAIPWRVEQLLNQYKGGTWVPEWSPLLLDHFGRLLEGRHRLTALVQYDKPLTFASYTRKES